MSRLPREMLTGNAAKAGPNEALQRIAARWRFCFKPQGFVWAARGKRER